MPSCPGWSALRLGRDGASLGQSVLALCLSPFSFPPSHSQCLQSAAPQVSSVWALCVALAAANPHRFDDGTRLRDRRTRTAPWRVDGEDTGRGLPVTGTPSRADMQKGILPCEAGKVIR